LNLDRCNLLICQRYLRKLSTKRLVALVELLGGRDVKIEGLQLQKNFDRVWSVSTITGKNLSWWC
jgi:hypothetical protein